MPRKSKGTNTFNEGFEKIFLTARKVEEKKEAQGSFLHQSKRDSSNAKVQELEGSRREAFSEAFVEVMR